MILELATLTLWAAGWVVLGRLRACRADVAPAVKSGQVSIIIPARNEAHNLPTLLDSLTTQPVKPREIIVVDDASTDRTADIAREFGARVVQAQPLPDGWRGKAWACHQGAHAATGEIFLFLDADTRFEPDGLGRVLAEFEGLRTGVLSVAPYHAVRDAYEQFSAFFNLVMHSASTAFTVFGERLPTRGLFGPLVLIRRTDYERAGGFEAVKGRILETFYFAGRLLKVGVPLHCRVGRGAFSIRMYPHGWRDMIGGWTRGFASGAGATSPWVLALVVAWMTGLMLPLVGLATCRATLLWLGLYVLCAAQLAWMLPRVGRFRLVTALAYPVPLTFYFAIFARSLQRSRNRKQVEWKGRQIRAD